MTIDDLSLNDYDAEWLHDFDVRLIATRATESIHFVFVFSGVHRPHAQWGVTGGWPRNYEGLIRMFAPLLATLKAQGTLVADDVTITVDLRQMQGAAQGNPTRHPPVTRDSRPFGGCFG